MGRFRPKTFSRGAIRRMTAFRTYPLRVCEVHTFPFHKFSLPQLRLPLITRDVPSAFVMDLRVDYGMREQTKYSAARKAEDTAADPGQCKEILTAAYRANSCFAGLRLNHALGYAYRHLGSGCARGRNSHQRRTHLRVPSGTKPELEGLLETFCAP